MVGSSPGGAGDRSEGPRSQGRGHSRGSRQQLYCCFNALLLCNKPPPNLITYHNHLFSFCNLHWFPLGSFSAPYSVHWDKNAQEEVASSVTFDVLAGKAEELGPG